MTPYIQVKAPYRWLPEPALHSFMQTLSIGMLSSSDFVRDRLLQHPWIAKVSVLRQWPSDWMIQLEEVSPHFFLNKAFVVTSKGEMIAISELSSEQLARMQHVPSVQSHAAVALSALIAHYTDFKALGLPITSAVVSEFGAWQLCIEQGVMLKLGIHHVQSRARRVLAVLDLMKDKLTQIQSLDGRYPDSVALNWRSSYTASRSCL